MANYPKRKPRAQKEPELDLLDELELFREWKKQILPELREMLLKGATAADIYKKYSAHAAARAVSIAISDPDSQKALTASKEIQDRASGKAVETRKVEHRMAELSDEQLDALLLTEISDNDDLQQ
jgi:hypothetical protein